MYEHAVLNVAHTYFWAEWSAVHNPTQHLPTFSISEGYGQSGQIEIPSLNEMPDRERVGSSRVACSSGDGHASLDLKQPDGSMP